MSLLNTMLKELEKRQVAAGGEQSLPGNIHSPVRRGYIALLLVLSALVGGAGALAWKKIQAPVTRPSVLQVVATNSLPETNPVFVAQTASEAASLTSAPPASAPPVSVLPAAVLPVAVLPASEPPSSVPPAGVQQVAKPTAGTVRKNLVNLQTEALEPTTLANDKAAKDSVMKSSNDKPKALAVQTPSFKIVRPQQQSDNSYKKAIMLLQNSRATEAQLALRQAIDINPTNHSARKLLAELLIDTGRNAEAEALLLDGLEILPGDGGFSMVLAHLQVANGAKEKALSTLEQGMSSAEYDAEYHAFIAALLQDKGHHAEATEHYITALRSNPSMPGWLMGVGISLQAENNRNDAAAAFQRAIDTGELSVEVAQFANQRLKQIRQQP